MADVKSSAVVRVPAGSDRASASIMGSAVPGTKLQTMNMMPSRNRRTPMRALNTCCIYIAESELQAVKLCKR